LDLKRDTKVLYPRPESNLTPRKIKRVGRVMFGGLPKREVLAGAILLGLISLSSKN